MRWIAGTQERLRGLVFRAREDAQMEEEMRFHLEMEAERLEREQGLPPGEARRRAAVAFGGVEKHKEEVREARGLAWVPGLSLDLKLGLRMLFKYPGLTLVGGLAVTVAIGLAAAWFEFTTDMFSPTLPLEDADRIVEIEIWDAAEAAPESRSLHDFVTWREELASVDELSASSTLDYNLSTEDGRFASVEGAQVTASAFRFTRVSPLLGRPLLEEDERPTAPPAIVIGYDLWQRLFDGDPGVIGRTVRVGASTSTVVGVMPEGFGFPVNEEVWAPLRANVLEYERGEGPAIEVWGRLAPGFTVEEAQAELTAIGQRTAAAFPETHEQLRPRIRQIGDGADVTGPLVYVVKLVFVLILIVICANVATLVYARTVTREGELAMRSALGASRKRLVLQLFAESLVLTSIAAAVGLAAAGYGLRWGMDLFWQVQQSRPPYWFDPGLSPSTFLYVGALALLGAAIVGGVPALRATRRNLRPGLNQLAAGGTRLRFGAVSTGVIIVQVALSVAILPIAVVRVQNALGDRLEITGFAADAYLSGELARQLDVPPSALPEAVRDEFVARTAALQDEARRRLAEVPGVTGVAFASRVPGMNHVYEAVRIEGGVVPADSAIDNAARTLAVDLGLFEVMDAPIVAGRGFRPSDLESGIGVAIVDEAFVEEILDGRNPVGQRLRYPGRPGEEADRWYEIVGVVRDLAMNAYGPGGYQDLVQSGPSGYVGIYHPLVPGEEASVQMFLRTEAPNPDALAPRIHSVVTSLDPSLAVDDLMTVEELWQPAHRSERFLTSMMVLLVAGVLGLSLAGIYALMSFTVSQRTREIGIRVALGASPRRIITTIFSRAIAQVGLGVLAGCLLVSLTIVETPEGARLVVAVAALMMAMGLLACVLPARRGLRIQPMEALREE